MSKKHELPQKLYFRIGEVSSIVGVEPHVLRYWEREFRGVRPTKSAKGQRVYSRKDVENLVKVKELLYQDGFTIAGAKKRLQGGAETSEEAQEVPAPPDTDPTLMLSTGGQVELEFDSSVEAASQAHLAPAATAAALTRPVALGLSGEWRERLVETRNEIESFLATIEKKD